MRTDEALLCALRDIKEMRTPSWWSYLSNYNRPERTDIHSQMLYLNYNDMVAETEVICFVAHKTRFHAGPSYKTQVRVVEAHWSSTFVQCNSKFEDYN